MSASLADAAVHNFVLHVSWPATGTPGMEVRVDPDLVLADSGLASDTFNCVCRARLAGETAPARIREAVGHFQRAQRPFSWWVSPGDGPADLEILLRDAGLEPTEHELAMALDLSRLGPGDSAPVGLEVRRVRAPDQLRDFARVTAANWDPPDEHVLRYYHRTAARLLASDSPVRLYVGYQGAEPVACAELTVGGGVVGLYNISTRSQWRRRGLGTALTARPLLDAKAEGERMAVLQAAAQGVSLYRRLGFETFGHITEYQPA